MGSFNVACSVSRITICPGTPVAYVPLELYKYAYDPALANNTLIYPWCYYVPASLPIFGEYFDYGYIDEIKKDAGTKAVEKHFNCPIEVVVGAQGQAPCPGMFVHRQIYDCLVHNRIDEWGQTKTNDEGYGLSSRGGLNKKYDALRKILIKVRDKKQQRKAAKDKDKWKFDTAIENFEMYEAVQKFGFREFETFMTIYQPLIQRGWLKKQFADFMFFNCSLNYANVHFFPAANGYQFGNHYGNRIVHEKAVNILDKIIIQEKRDTQDEY